jgi:hypothetical protein
MPFFGLEVAGEFSCRRETQGLERLRKPAVRRQLELFTFMSALERIGACQAVYAHFAVPLEPPYPEPTISSHLREYTHRTRYRSIKRSKKNMYIH